MQWGGEDTVNNFRTCTLTGGSLMRTSKLRALSMLGTSTLYKILEVCDS